METVKRRQKAYKKLIPAYQRVMEKKMTTDAYNQLVAKYDDLDLGRSYHLHLDKDDKGLDKCSRLEYSGRALNEPEIKTYYNDCVKARIRHSYDNTLAGIFTITDEGHEFRNTHVVNKLYDKIEEFLKERYVYN